MTASKDPRARAGEGGTSGAVYLHGVEPVEQERLSRLNELLNEGSLRELALAPGERVLEFGSGLGQFARAMARRVGSSGRVVGIERSAEQLARAAELARAAGEAGLIEMREGDVSAPPLAPDEWGGFDVAHARFLLEHVPDPLAVVRQMVRAVRVGGRIVLEDDDHDRLRLWPEAPGFATLWDAYVRLIHVNDNDPYVGRRLVGLLHRAGARPRRTAVVFFGGCAGSPELATMIENIVGLFEGVRERMLEKSLIAERDYQRAIASLRAWGERPDAALWYEVLWAEGVRVD
jgi:SAM-dependent methyltransferase